ncbi:helix-turn-helix transcriptional regulator [Geodermatophilus sabuli]|uniref:Helix-turn-helix transcriptional regulator n=2 Tax=Geodermatophilus sabuli TaxID=1564158 RepID=A0A7K3VXT0_9ACTN|nr:TetR family transcriptional regulator [Geodermatophilus sabuli]NEK57210.1 helix-turn-helix transcriptional regulator [Geodermatophilus sabuli]
MMRTRAGLLDGAIRAFAERGLRRSTMQSVAAAAGVAKATLYNHFRTKDDVARALLAAEVDRLATSVTGLPAAAALGVLAEEVAGHPVLRRLAADEPEALVALLGVPAARWSEVVARLAEALGGVDAAAAEVVAAWLAGLVLQPGEPASRAEAAARLAVLLPPGDTPA